MVCLVRNSEFVSCSLPTFFRSCNDRAVAQAGVWAKWPLRGKESYVNNVPASFDCEMRKLAYAYGKKLPGRLWTLLCTGVASD